MLALVLFGLSLCFSGICAQFSSHLHSLPVILPTDAQEERCPSCCPRIMNPVCAYDGVRDFKFFYNECLMRTHRCESQRDWTPTHMTLCLHLLDPEVLRQCLHPCPFEFQPVCARNGKRTEIVGNECIFNVENCFDNGKWSKLASDLCAF